jgi:hypothetical protein
MLDPALLAGGGLDGTGPSALDLTDDTPRSIHCHLGRHDDCPANPRCQCACGHPAGPAPYTDAEIRRAELAEEPRYAPTEAGLRFLAFALGADIFPGLASDLEGGP